MTATVITATLSTASAATMAIIVIAAVFSSIERYFIMCVCKFTNRAVSFKGFIAFLTKIRYYYSLWQILVKNLGIFLGFLRCAFEPVVGIQLSLLSLLLDRPF